MNRHEILTMLKDNQWEFLRSGKGSHRIYWQPATGRKLTVSGLHSDRDKTRHSARKLMSEIQRGAIA